MSEVYYIWGEVAISGVQIASRKVYKLRKGGRSLLYSYAFARHTA
jgi:hypothetical protein